MSFQRSKRFVHLTAACQRGTFDTLYDCHNCEIHNQDMPISAELVGRLGRMQSLSFWRRFSGKLDPTIVETLAGSRCILCAWDFWLRCGMVLSAQSEILCHLNSQPGRHLFAAIGRTVPSQALTGNYYPPLALYANDHDLWYWILASTKA